MIPKQAELSIGQKSFHDHMIQNQEDYEEHLRYIDENPIRWCRDELYTEGSVHFNAQSFVPYALPYI